jgi:hypothetical protein
VNAIGQPVGDRSGEVRLEYGYDDLSRLTYAHGEAKSRAHTIDRFTSTYAYSDVYNMTSNVQVHDEKQTMYEANPVRSMPWAPMAQPVSQNGSIDQVLAGAHNKKRPDLILRLSTNAEQDAAALAALAEFRRGPLNALEEYWLDVAYAVVLAAYCAVLVRGIVRGGRPSPG